MITIEMMQQAGIPNELILKVKAIEEMERRAARREQNRINKRNQRLRQHVSADSADIADMNVEIAQENLSATASAETGTKIAQEESFLKTQKVRKKDSIGAHRIAVDWKPTEADRAWSLRYGMNLAEIEGQGERFKDYWTARGGQLARKTDWQATWRNWCRKFLDDNPRQASFIPPARKAEFDAEDERRRDYWMRQLAEGKHAQANH